jgi:hypothetical protein
MASSIGRNNMWKAPDDERVETPSWTAPADERVDAAPAQSEKSLGGLVGNAVSDVGDMVGGLGNAAMHPIDTATNVATHLPEIGHSMAHSWGLDSADSGHRMDTLKEEAYKHPVSHLLDAASVVIPGLKAAGLAPEALEGANIASKVGEGAGEVSDALGRRALGYTKAGLKNGGLEKANEATHYAIDNGILTPGAKPTEMLDATKAGLSSEGGKIGDILKSEPGAFDSSMATQRLEALRPRGANGEILRGGKYDALNSEIDESLNTINAHGGGEMPWERANELKKTVREGTNFSPMKDTGVNNMRKSLGGEFNNELDTQLGKSMKARGADIEPLLDAKEAYGHLKGLVKALDNRVATTSGNRTIGVMDAAAGGMGGLLHGPVGAIAGVVAKKAIEKYGLTGGAVLGRKLAVILENPAMLEKYGSMLDKAVTAGPAEVATTMHLIEQHDPAFPKEGIQ